MFTCGAISPSLCPWPGQPLRQRLDFAPVSSKKRFSPAWKLLQERPRSLFAIATTLHQLLQGQILLFGKLCFLRALSWVSFIILMIPFCLFLLLSPHEWARGSSYCLTVDWFCNWIWSHRWRLPILHRWRLLGVLSLGAWTNIHFHTIRSLKDMRFLVKTMVFHVPIVQG